MFELWKGNYAGSVTWTMRTGPLVKSIQASLIVVSHGKEIKIDLKTSRENKRWIFYIKPDMLSSMDIELEENQVYQGKNYHYKVCFTSLRTKSVGKT